MKSWASHSTLTTLERRIFTGCFMSPLSGWPTLNIVLRTAPMISKVNVVQHRVGVADGQIGVLFYHHHPGCEAATLLVEHRFFGLSPGLALVDLGDIHHGAGEVAALGVHLDDLALARAAHGVVLGDGQFLRCRYGTLEGDLAGDLTAAGGAALICQCHLEQEKCADRNGATGQ